MTVPRDDDLYDRDPHAWFLAQAALLRAGRTDEADLLRIAEELECLARAEARDLRDSLRLICGHLLKWQQHPEERSRSWVNAIERERDNAALLLKENPSLATKVAKLFIDAYSLSRWEAARDADLSVDLFPAELPFTLDEALTPGWLPPD